MSSQNADRRLDSLVFRAFVSRGFRPETDAEIDAMLDALGGEALPKEKMERMLRKIGGEEPIGIKPAPELVSDLAGLTSDQRELVALCRAEGREIPPEIQAVLDEMRKRAAEHKQDNEEPRNGT